MNQITRGLISLCLPLILSIHPAQANPDPSRASAELAQIRSKIQARQQQLDQALANENQLLSQLKHSEQQINTLSNQIKQLTERQQQQQQEKTALENDLLIANEQLADEYEQLRQQAQLRLQLGQQPQLKLLLNQQQPQKLARLMTYLNYVNHARIDTIQTIEDLLKQIKHLHHTLAEQSQILSQTLNQQQQQQQQLNQQYSQRQQTLTALRQQISQDGQQLNQLRQDEQRLAKLVEELQQLLTDIPKQLPGDKPFAKLAGQLNWPISPLNKSKVSRAENNPNGIIIAGKTGQPVQAIYRGRVAYADWLRGFGLITIIDHDDGFMSLYGRNQSLFKETGDWVETGETIAELGDSGAAQQPGLYFEIRKNGQPSDPERWLN